MKIKYLGTAAAEGIPAVFCNCETCNKARLKGGKNLMSRSQALIDDKILIDLPADTYWHFTRAGKSLGDIGHLFVTHFHIDHFSLDDLTFRRPTFAYDFKHEKLNLYCSNFVAKILRHNHRTGDYINETVLDERYNIIILEKFKTVSVEGYYITPLPAKHARPAEEAVIFLIEKEGKTVFYGNDTGIIDNEIIDWLVNNNKKIDLLSLDCTKGDMPYEYYTHMGFEENLKIFRHFLSKGICSEKTIKISTHFSHNCKMIHDELEEAAKKYGFTVTHDGMEVSF